MKIALFLSTSITLIMYILMGIFSFIKIQEDIQPYIHVELPKLVKIVEKSKFFQIYCNF